MRNRDRFEDLLQYDHAILALHTESISLCESVTSKLQEYGDTMTETWKKEHDARIKERYTGPSPVLVGIGAGLVGVLGGLLIGIFAN